MRLLDKHQLQHVINHCDTELSKSEYSENKTYLQRASYLNRMKATATLELTGKLQNTSTFKYMDLVEFYGLVVNNGN